MCININAMLSDSVVYHLYILYISLDQWRVTSTSPSKNF
jgi:hypothetical protein